MPSVRLDRDETLAESLPNACMVCGEPAAVHKYKKFSKTPGWVIVVILFCGLLPGLIVALLTAKKMAVDVPFCDRHRHHWSARTAGVLLGLLACIGLGVGLAAFTSEPANKQYEGLLLLIPVALIAWLVLTAVLTLTSVRASAITDRSITLLGVSQRFIDALDDLRDEDDELERQEREERRGRFGRPDDRLQPRFDDDD